MAFAFDQGATPSLKKVLANQARAAAPLAEVVETEG
jgi:hypothetical protein